MTLLFPQDLTRYTRKPTGYNEILTGYNAILTRYEEINSSFIYSI